MSENLNALEKAQVLIEALPYIQRFNRKIIVVKYGGSAMLDEELQKNVIKDVTFLKLVGFKPIIVHGGGKEISKWVSKAGMEPKFIDGLRVTDAETMEIAEMVLNKVNKNLVRMVEELGVRAIGVSGKDGGLLRVDKKLSMTGQDVGFVGDIKKVNAEVLLDLLDKEALIRILTEPKSSLVKQYQKLMELDGVKLEFDKAALDAIAETSLARKTGARGLRAIMEDIMMDTMFRVPSDDTIKGCMITKDVVEGKGQPLYECDGEERKSFLTSESA